MNTSTTVKNGFGTSTSRSRYRYSKNELFIRDYYRSGNLSGVKFRETATGYHFELKIPGYIRDDFYFYLSGTDLVVTTAKRMVPADTGDRELKGHSYCYPSALFKRRFAVPTDIVRNEIFFDYRDEILKFELVKAND